MPFATDTFTGTAGDPLETYAPSSWAKHPAQSGSLILTSAGRVRAATNPTTGQYLHSAIPGGADYSVQLDVRAATTTALNWDIAVLLRYDATTDNGYRLMYRVRNTSTVREWRLEKVVNGAATLLGSVYADAIANGASRTAKLTVTGNALSVTIDGTERITATDNTFITAGRVGVYALNGSTVSDTAGGQFDNFSASTGAAPAFTATPAITGTLTTGQTITCSAGTATGTPAPALSYQWTLNGLPLGGETANTLKLVTGYEGATVGCIVTATNTDGSATATATGGGTVGAGTGAVRAAVGGAWTESPMRAAVSGAWS